MEEYFRRRREQLAHEAHSPDLERDRKDNDRKLKSRFESIFEKYEKDFSGVGDEIDLETGEVIVDNGHLQSMQNEADPGQGASAQLVRAFAEGSEDESGDSSLSDCYDPEATVSTDDGEEDDNSDCTGDTTEDASDRDGFLGREGTPESVMPLTDEGEAVDAQELDKLNALARLAAKPHMPPAVLPDDVDPSLSETGIEDGPKNAANTLRDPDAMIGTPAVLALQAATLPKPVDPSLSQTEPGSESTLGENASRESSPEDAVLEAVPDFLKDSMRAIRSSSQHGKAVDPDAILALGQSIARQIAEFMSGTSKKDNSRSQWRTSKGKEKAWDYPELPKPKRVRTASPSPTLLFPAATPAASTPSKQSLWAPIEHPRKRRRKRKRPNDGTTAIIQQHVETTNIQDGTALDHANIDAIDEVGHLQAACAHIGEAKRPKLRTCNNCGTHESKSFRAGLDGELCSSCGMYYYRYGLMKPLDDSSSELDFEDEEAIEKQMPESLAHLHMIGPRPAEDPGIFDLPQSDAPDVPAHLVNTGPRVYTAAYRAQAGKSTGRGLRMTRFTPEEDMLIIKLKEIKDLPWDLICKSFPDRSAYSVQCRYTKKLHNRFSEARVKLIEQGYRFSQADRAMDEAQPVDSPREETVMSLPGGPYYLAHGHYADFKIDQPQNESFSDAKHKLRQRKAKKTRLRVLDPSNAKYRANEPFKPEEDEQIKKLREIDKLTWEEVAQRVPGRTVLSLQKRYVRKLVGKEFVRPRQMASESLAKAGYAVEHAKAGKINPTPADRYENIKHTRYTAEEDALLKRLRDEERLGWTGIEERMSGRTATSLSNRYAYKRNQDLVTPLDSSGYPRKEAAQTPDYAHHIRSEGLSNSKCSAMTAGPNLDAHRSHPALHSRSGVPRTCPPAPSELITDLPPQASASFVALGAGRRPINNSKCGSSETECREETVEAKTSFEQNDDQGFSPTCPETPMHSEQLSTSRFMLAPEPDYSTPARWNQQEKPYYVPRLSMPYKASDNPVDASVDAYQVGTIEAAAQQDPTTLAKPGAPSHHHGPQVYTQRAHSEPVQPRQVEWHQLQPRSCTSQSQQAPQRRPTQPVQLQHPPAQLTQTQLLHAKQVRLSRRPVPTQASERVRYDERDQGDSDEILLDSATQSVGTGDESVYDISAQSHGAKSFPGTEKPPYSCAELISMALNSSSTKAMLSIDICKYIEERFEYYHLDAGNWRGQIRSNLSKQPEFRKLHDSKRSLWSFTNPTGTITKPTAEVRRPKPGPKPCSKPGQLLPGSVDNSQGDGGADKNALSSSEPPVKRKRGRPRKNPLPAGPKVSAATTHTATPSTQVASGARIGDLSTNPDAKTQAVGCEDEHAGLVNAREQHEDVTLLAERPIYSNAGAKVRVLGHEVGGGGSLRDAIVEAVQGSKVLPGGADKLDRLLRPSSMVEPQADFGSEIDREPESSPVAARSSSRARWNRVLGQPEMPVIHVISGNATEQNSSPPFTASRRPAVASVYGRSRTAKFDVMALSAVLKQQVKPAPSPGSAMQQAASQGVLQPSTVTSTRRSAHASRMEYDESEDELAR